MGFDTYAAGDITAVIGDNEGSPPHKVGYNGVWSLRHTGCPRSIFTPDSGGLNHEHIFDGETDDTLEEVFFEPRRAPMDYRRISAVECELHQPPTPIFQLESWTEFRLEAPHYVDMTYRCRLHRPAPRGWLGLFWASYIDGPEDKSIYFLGGVDGDQDVWSQLCTQRHNDESTVRRHGDSVDLTFRESNRPSLFRNLSPLRFDKPFYYGHFEEHVWIMMFDRADGIRFAHSPSGGGLNRERHTTNPAWDFQFIIPNADVGGDYGFRVRAAFRARCTREEIVKEFRSWNP